MRLIFTRRKNIESKLIQWGTESDSSHFAIVLYEETVPIVLQSNFLGVDFQSWKMFSKHAEVVHQIIYPMSQSEEDQIFDEVVKNIIGEEYDWGAFAYFGWRCFLFKVFKIKFPEVNAWARTDRSLCVELAYAMPDRVVPFMVKQMDLGMVYPSKLFSLIGFWKGGK